MDNIKSKLQSLLEKVKPKLILLDEKFAKLITDSKLRKIMYFFIGGFLGFIVLIIIVGIITLPFRVTNNNDGGLVLKRPNIVNSSPIPQKELNETQKSLLNLENRTKDLKFPESVLNIPVIEKNLSI
jgi:hypothetical protein